MHGKQDMNDEQVCCFLPFYSQEKQSSQCKDKQVTVKDVNETYNTCVLLKTAMLACTIARLSHFVLAWLDAHSLCAYFRVFSGFLCACVSYSFACTRGLRSRCIFFFSFLFAGFCPLAPLTWSGVFSLMKGFVFFWKQFVKSSVMRKLCLVTSPTCKSALLRSWTSQTAESCWSNMGNGYGRYSHRSSQSLVYIYIYSFLLFVPLHFKTLLICIFMPFWSGNDQLPLRFGSWSYSC